MLQALLHGMIADTAAGGGFSVIVPFAAIFVVMYFLILRPQSQQQKKQQQFLSQLKKGDEVVLQSGFYGKIFEVRDPDLVIELAPNVKVRVLKTSVTGPATTAAAKAADARTETEKKT